MPPPRKKAQGKARKAAKAKREEEKEREAESDATQDTETNQQRRDESVGAQLQRMQITGPLRGVSATVKKCMHGYASSSPEEERICVEFIEAYRVAHNTAIERSVEDLAEVFLAAISHMEEKYVQVWNDVTMMEKVVSYLLCIGTKHFLDGNSDGARRVAYYACYFEQFIAGVFHKSQAIIDCAKVLETLDADEHTLVQFFHKRVPCSCLDEKYKEVKSITKMGICCNPECTLPERKAARSTMLYCTRCRAKNYCSQECQVAAWPSHRESCNSLVALKAESNTKK
jgi:hypothetical protein